MTNSLEQHSKKVVDHFREILGPDATQHITDSQFEELEQMVRSAIADELELVTEEFNETVKAIKRHIEKREMEL
ncbi:hypothetical protein [Solemya velesiana gill symbiont]|uniref:Phosphatase n=1 Tax=Solemya velesiana gill symbiont TaxID=1918948 RepID=A0A1T2KSW1_9GAMM|nr:hypothetical protein [Solemya velesiana gill symbiont]OOZ35800.1 hypothetical protein BOW51_10235 [Solemya velesiana gill symbiont]